MTDSPEVTSEVKLGDLPIDDELNRAEEFDQFLRVHFDVQLVRSYADPNGWLFLTESSDD